MSRIELDIDSSVDTEMIDTESTTSTHQDTTRLHKKSKTSHSSKKKHTKKSMQPLPIADNALFGVLNPTTQIKQHRVIIPLLRSMSMSLGLH
jgi:aspartyl/asparaginyl beta-hydroxylase (cupin superfamily)